MKGDCMKKNSTAEKNTAPKGEKKELQQAFALWKATGKSGTLYFSGKVADDNNFKIVAFINGKKKNAKEPDIRVYAKEDTKKEIASLWEQVSPTTGRRYFTGKDNEDKKLVAFYNNGEKTTQPYIRVYYQEEK